MGLHLNQFDDELVENHEINVTPFIDVILVLLIIFMASSPVRTVDIKVDLPDSRASPGQRPDIPIFLSLKSDHRLFLGEEEVKTDTLGPVLEAKTQGKKDMTIFFQADKGVDYGDLISVMNSLRASGYLKVGLVGLEMPSKK